jgi:hypothetical protein
LLSAFIFLMLTPSTGYFFKTKHKKTHIKKYSILTIKTLSFLQFSPLLVWLLSNHNQIFYIQDLRFFMVHKFRNNRNKSK